MIIKLNNIYIYNIYITFIIFIIIELIVINEIKERQEFLNDMTALGQAKKYKSKIQFEINEVTKCYK